VNKKIGAANESSLHRLLKYRYTGENGCTETAIGEFVCDGQTGDGEIIEVQTGSFGPLMKKVKTLSGEYRIKIIHPIIITRYIETMDINGNFLRKRKSAKKGSIWDLFTNLIYAPEMPELPKLCIELALIDIVEKRVDDGTGSWRRKGIRIADKSLTCWHSSVVLNCLKDYYQFIPFKKNETFSAKSLGEKAGINQALAGKCLYVMRKLNLVKKIGKEKNAYVYRRTAKTGILQTPPKKTAKKPSVPSKKKTGQGLKPQAKMKKKTGKKNP
jgi:hypothetical protein